jgi:hypothetical protein
MGLVFSHVLEQFGTAKYHVDTISKTFSGNVAPKLQQSFFFVEVGEIPLNYVFLPPHGLVSPTWVAFMTGKAIKKVGGHVSR